MSKSKINPKEFLKDLNEALGLISKLDNTDPKKTDYKKIEKEASKIEKKLKKKYENLDTRK